ncbi:MAG TPA: hypothetical protein VGJ06_08295 [Candidatus Acidoferrum sp.]|jgi:hypothetical protein
MSALSDKVIAVSKPYLGPATESFIARQCQSHLKVDPSALSAINLKALSEWVERSGSLVMDPAKATELAKKIAVMT